MRHARLPFFRVLLLVLSASTQGAPAWCADRLVGDLDNDGVITALDLARQIAHARGRATLAEAELPYADVNGDGLVNSYDSDAIVRRILQTEEPAALPLASVLETSPARGESGVSLTREFVLRFSMPLALDAVVTTHNPNDGTTGHISAEFGGRRILTRAELSSDRRKATLFFLEPLPSSARVRVTFDPAGLEDLLGRPVDGDGDGVAGGVQTVDFDTLSTSALPGTGVTGRVFGIDVGTNNALTTRPLAGVTITVDGAEETLRTTTAADGTFSLLPAPAGRFFVLIDGRTASGSGSGGYYAFVGKAWEGIAGRIDTPVTQATANTEAGDIFLPFIPEGTLQPVSATQDTTITFASSVLAADPQLADVQIVVPANALFSDTGARGGQVGIAPVAPQRLPEPLPPGLELPLVITIQTDGATNFDRPVPVRFPNLVDPATGRKLPPGAKSSLVSFNHDTGTWELVGPMTVTADGRFVETDRGVGVRQPGWHGSGPFGSLSGSGDPPCLDKIVGDNARSMELYKEAEEILDARALDTVKKAAEITAELLEKAPAGTWRNLIGDVAGAALGVIDPIFKTRDCINQALDGAPNFFGKKSIFYMPRGCVDMAVEFALLPLEEAKVVGKTGLAILKSGKAIVDLSDTLKDVQDITDKLDQANALIEEIIPCKPAGAPPDDPIATWYADLKRSLDDFARAAPEADEAFARLDALQPTLDALHAQMDPTRTDLGFTHEQQATYAITVLEVAGHWQTIAGPDGYIARAVRLIQAWQAYSNTFLVLNTYRLPLPNGHPFKPNRVVYMIEHGGIQQRITTNNGGGFEVFLPAGAIATVWAYEIDKKWVARAGPLIGPAAGSRMNLPVLTFWPQSAAAPDPDNDGLTSVAERIVGSDPTRADTDGDGMLDGAALMAGRDPAAGRPSLVGIVASLDTPGSATDVAGRDNLIAVADSASGVVLFDAADRTTPRQLAVLATPGPARAVALERPWLAAAVDTAGVSFVDISDSSAPRLAQTVGLGAATTSVALSGGLALAGTNGAQVVSVDAATQQIVSRIALSGAIQDVAFGRGDVAYAMVAGRLHVLRVLEDGSLQGIRDLAVPGGVGAGGRRLRLFPALDRLYVTFVNGVNALDTTDPEAPVLLQTNNSATQFGWKQIVLATPGLGVAAVGNNSTNDGPHNVQLHDLAANGTLSAARALVATPGIASAVSVLNGLAFVADSADGLQVVNYLATETGTTPPTVALSGNFTLTPSPRAEEGARLLLTVDARDDVQVRNVELILDGVLVQNDGSFPFEFGFAAPTRAGGRTHFRLQVRAFDTAGNSTASDVLNVELAPDATPPRVVRVLPPVGALSGNLAAMSALFSEPLAPATASPEHARCRSAGPDRIFETADDAVVASLALAYDADARSLTLSQATSLPPGRYRFELTTGLTDLAGNALAANVTRMFEVFGFADRDGDGVPDDLEAALGLDPENSDSDGDGIRDGDEDFDNDGLGNAYEVLLELDPRIVDSDGNGVNDAGEDADADSLTNRQEVLAGTSPVLADTDGDQWNDEAELSGSGDPLNAARGPRLTAIARPPVDVVLYSISGSSADISAGTVIGRPSVEVVLYSIAASSGDLSGGMVIGRPVVDAVLYSIPASSSEISTGTIVGRPTVDLTLYSIPAATADLETGTVIGKPQVTVTRPSN